MSFSLSVCSFPSFTLTLSLPPLSLSVSGVHTDFVAARGPSVLRLSSQFQEKLLSWHLKLICKLGLDQCGVVGALLWHWHWPPIKLSCWLYSSSVRYKTYCSVLYHSICYIQLLASWSHLDSDFQSVFWICCSTGQGLCLQIWSLGSWLNNHKQELLPCDTIFSHHFYNYRHENHSMFCQPPPKKTLHSSFLMFLS